MAAYFLLLLCCLILNYSLSFTFVNGRARFSTRVALKDDTSPSPLPPNPANSIAAINQADVNKNSLAAPNPAFVAGPRLNALFENMPAEEKYTVLLQSYASSFRDNPLSRNETMMDTMEVSNILVFFIL